MIDLIITSFAICGLYLSAQDGMLLNFLTKFFDKYDKLGMPIILCPTCMSSVWGTIAYLSFNNEYLIKDWILFVLALAFLNTIFISIYYKLKD